MKGLLATTSIAGAVTSPLFQALNAMFPGGTVLQVPVSSWGAAAFGAVISLFFGEAPPSRRRLFGECTAAMGFGVAIAVLMSDGLDLDWATNNASMFAMVCAGVVRWFMPPVIDRGKRFIHESNISLPFLKRKEPPQ